MNMLAMPETELLEDAELVGLCLKGDRDAFGGIVERYQSLICALAYSACGDLARSEDLAQETFIAAWRQLASLREPARLKSWLCGIARNLLRNSARAQTRNPLATAVILEDEVAAGPEGEAPWACFERTDTEIVWGISLVGLVFKVNRAAVIERAVESAAVIEGFDKIEDGLASLGASLEVVAIDQFLFEGAPERFHGGIVIGAGFAAHGREALALRQGFTEVRAGVLATAVRMKDQGWGRLAMSLGHVPSGQDELGVDRLVHRPADDPAAVGVHNPGQVEPAFLGGDVGDVAEPDLIESARSGPFGQAIGSDRLVVVAVGGGDSEPSFRASTEAVLTH